MLHGRTTSIFAALAYWPIHFRGVAARSSDAAERLSERDDLRE
jgi:hypothetical protein